MCLGGWKCDKQLAGNIQQCIFVHIPPCFLCFVWQLVGWGFGFEFLWPGLVSEMASFLFDWSCVRRRLRSCGASVLCFSWLQRDVDVGLGDFDWDFQAASECWQRHFLLVCQGAWPGGGHFARKISWAFIPSCLKNQPQNWERPSQWTVWRCFDIFEFRFQTTNYGESAWGPLHSHHCATWQCHGASPASCRKLSFPRTSKVRCFIGGVLIDEIKQKSAKKCKKKTAFFGGCWSKFLHWTIISDYCEDGFFAGHRLVDSPIDHGADFSSSQVLLWSFLMQLVRKSWFELISLTVKSDCKSSFFSLLWDSKDSSEKSLSLIFSVNLNLDIFQIDLYQSWWFLRKTASASSQFCPNRLGLIFQLRLFLLQLIFALFLLPGKGFGSWPGGLEVEETNFQKRPKLRGPGLSWLITGDIISSIDTFFMLWYGL